MGLIKEPKNVDFSMKSEPWTEKELADFRKIMQAIKAKNTRRKTIASGTSKKNKQPELQKREPPLLSKRL